MKKIIVFLVIMVMLCSTAYAIYPESASTSVLTSRSIVIKATPITGNIIDPLFRPTSKTEQNGLIIMNGRQQTNARGVVLPDFKPTTTEQKGLIIWNGKSGSASLGGEGDPHAPAGIIGDCGRQTKGMCDTAVKGYPDRDGKQKQSKTSIIDPIFQRGTGQSTKEIVDPTFKKGSNAIIDPSFKTGTNAIIDPLFIVDPTFKPASGQSTKGIVDPTFKTSAGRKYTKAPTGRWIEDITAEAVINVPKLTQTSMSSNPYYLGGATKTMTAGQAYSMGQKSITQASNPYALGGAAVPTTAGQAKSIDEILKERQQKATAALGRVY